MSSWFKVAEDLLEVVDRRAKLVANELSDEQSESKPSVSNGQEFQARSIKPKEKVQLRLVPLEPRKTNDSLREQISLKASEENALPDADEPVLSSKTDEPVLPSKTDEGMLNVDTDQNHTKLLPDLNVETSASEISIPYSLLKDVRQNGDTGKIEVPSTINYTEAGVPVNDEFTTKTTIDDRVDSFSSDPPATGADNEDRNFPGNVGQDIKSKSEDVSQKVDHVGSEVGYMETHGNNYTQANEEDTKEQPSLPSKKQSELKSNIPSMKVQEQLDEAQGLLKSAISTGQSKEARLARVCAGLSSRLQEYKSENAQLEELLSAERERRNSFDSYIKKLEQDISTSKSEVSRVESHMAEALAAKNSEIDALVNSLDKLKKQATESEGKVASLQVNMESMMRNRELSETRMMQALREELTSVQRRAEEECIAHNATKVAAREREVELEHRAVDTSTALARMQRAVDERTSRVAELEQRLALLEVESTSLNQELQDMESRVCREQKKSVDEGNQTLKLQAWQDEVDRAREGQREAESKLSALEAEAQKMRVEMAGMKRDAEHYSRQEHMELEKRYRELADLLYHKQTQLESMASEKAAAEFQLEKEMKRLQEAQVEAEKVKAPRRASSSYWEEETDLKALEPLPLHHRHIAGARLQLQKAAKLLDSGAVTATRFLWRYPVARVMLLLYMVFVHLFLMYLLHRLQEQVDSFAAQEVAASMGLSQL